MSKAMAAALNAVGQMGEVNEFDDALAFEVFRHPEEFTLVRGAGPYPDCYISRRSAHGVTATRRHVCMRASAVESIRQIYGRVQ